MQRFFRKRLYKKIERTFNQHVLLLLLPFAFFLSFFLSHYLSLLFLPILFIFFPLLFRPFLFLGRAFHLLFSVNGTTAGIVFILFLPKIRMENPHLRQRRFMTSPFLSYKHFLVNRNANWNHRKCARPIFSADSKDSFTGRPFSDNSLCSISHRIKNCFFKLP